MDIFAERIWSLKYRLDTAGHDGEPRIEDSWRRVAASLAAVEAPDNIAPQQARFFDAMLNYRLLPAGRILNAAGHPERRTMINTFVMADFDESIESVLRVCQDAASTMRMGGGIGYDFSRIAPRGTALPGDKGASAGALAAMEVCDATGALLSLSERRGAMMATMRCDHPEIREFVQAKGDRARFRNFNMSVMVTDALMRAVEQDAAWELCWEGRALETLPARALWDLIMRQTFETAEPGVIFIDRINAENPIGYLERISATNSCAEQPLPPNGSAPLASINLARLVRNPFESGAHLDLAELRSLAGTAVRMLDNVIEVSPYPTPAQAAEAGAKRRIGIGVTGAANALAMIGERYGSARAATHLGTWIRELQHATTRASVELARTRGAFSGFCPERYGSSDRIRALDPDLQRLIARHGVRNALTTSIAPTGTISLLAGNVSSGIEPVFAISCERRFKLPGGQERTTTLEDYAVQVYRQKFGRDTPLPPQFVTAQDLAPEEHVVMQAAAQRWVESSISKTVNCPEEIDFDAFKDVYRAAYQSGCKGCTTYRPNPITGAVLKAVAEPERKAPPKPARAQQQQRQIPA